MVKRDAANSAIGFNDIPHHKIAVVGSGFSGIGMGVKLKQAGETDFVIFEKEAGVGGTWRVNHYPGCACDVQSHLYSFSFEQNPNWSRAFSPQKEIEQYLVHCTEKYGLSPHIVLNKEIVELRWQEKAGYWLITDSEGAQSTAAILVLATGGLSRPAYPDIPGLNKFSGSLFHSQQWNHDVDLRDKRVAVIGTGASAIQFVPQIQPLVKKLHLYQRSAPWVMPKPDKAMSLFERTLFKRLPISLKAFRAFIYSMLEFRVIAFTMNPKLMGTVQRMAEKYIRRQISDPELIKKVTPDYTLGCKRVLMSNDYYAALSQPNLEVVTTGIKEITADSIIRVDGSEEKADAIILGTGFKAVELPSNVIFGYNGVDITDAWSNGVEAYKGTVVNGFPNMFMITGPNTGLGHSSMIYMIESHINYIMSAIKKINTAGLHSVTVKPEVQAKFNINLQEKIKGSVWNTGGCKSWYLDENGRNVTLWPKFTWQFRLLTRKFDDDNFTCVPNNKQTSSDKTGVAAHNSSMAVHSDS